MGTTITIRAGDRLRRELEERATAEGKSLSAVVREILENALTAQPMAQRVGHLRGRLKLRADDGDEWRRKLRERNWRS